MIVRGTACLRERFMHVGATLQGDLLFILPSGIPVE